MKKINITNKNLEAILENDEDSVLMYPHSYARVNHKSVVPSIIFSVVIFILVIIGINLSYNYLFPTNIVMKVGDIVITKDRYDAIYNADILPAKDSVYSSQELSDIDKEEIISMSDYYSRENLYYIKEKILLGLKAKELGYKIDKNKYDNKLEVYGELSEYFLLANSLKNMSSNSSINLSNQEKKSIYKNIKETDLIDYDKSTITYQKYYTDTNFNPLSNSQKETFTQTYREFSASNYVKNVPKQDAYYDISNNSYIYYKVLETNEVYYPFKDSEEYIENSYAFFKTNGILDAYILEMENKYPVTIYV